MRPQVTIKTQGEQMLVCRECGSMFFSMDADRKYCDAHLTDRVNGAGILEDDDEEDMFFLRANVCDRCGATFETSRRSRLCALCAGPQATVRCPGCNVEHQVPVLAPHKLCKCCTVDLEITASALRARLDVAQAAADEAWLRLDADLAHADGSDRARYDAACERASEWPAERWHRARDAAIAKGDGLSPLLVARLRLDDAVLALDRVKAEVAMGLEEVERAR